MIALKNELVVVTGATSAIGEAIALELAKHGAICLLLGRRKDELKKVTRAVSEKSPSSLSLQLDLTIDSNIDKLYSVVEERFGRVNILIHCAGIYHSQPFEKASIENFDEQYRTNVRAPFLITQKLLPLILSAKGQIIFINSTQGVTAGANLSQYASTQHSLKAIADSLREEVNPYGVRVMSLFLGRTATGRIKKIFHNEGKDYNPDLLIQPFDVASIIAQLLVLPKTAEVTNLNIRPMIKSY